MTSEALYRCWNHRYCFLDFRQRCLARSRTDNYHNCSCCGDNHCDCDRLDRQQRRLLSYVHVQEPYIWPCSV
ncbi:hypothetical protein, partial [Klebsiella pneumoniae]|uniref:hypothetical protein n=1 Tax=Klebsiella pneumoniae TaxID=573 RepID=UPI00216830F9